MSHGHSGRGSCFRRFSGTMLHSRVPERAGDVTDVDVGSGALLDGSGARLAVIKIRTGSGEANFDEQHRVRLTIRVVDSS